MRPFEVILLVLLSSLPFIIFLVKLTFKRIFCIVGFIFCILLHLIFEGYRWQMIPAYFLILLMSLLINREFKKTNKTSKVLVSIFSIILVSISWIIPLVFPVFKLPNPTGHFHVASQYIQLKTNLQDVFSDNEDSKRSFMVKVWYPVDEPDGETEKYLDKGNRVGFTSKYQLPESTLNYLDYVDTHTYNNKSVAKGKFPVLIFSHGLNSEAFGYYAILEEIVSHGFIVININHTYESSGSQFSDHEIKLYDKSFDLKTNDQEMQTMAWTASQAYNKAVTDSEKFEAIEDLILDYVAADISERWSDDISFVIDYLNQIDSNSFLKSHMDLSKIGAFGHSQGGSAVGLAMLNDDRIQAGVNLDGAQWGNMVNSTLQKPFMLLSSDWDKNHMDINKFSYQSLENATYKSLFIENSGHSNFMDIPLMVNLPIVNEAGSIDPLKSYSIITQLVINFFNQHFENTHLKIDNLIEEYDKMKLKK
ncbi:alpha/beta hydrolase family protein [Psychroflexus montanilacus]|uniref:alpha/beta hydrolase family protein n=1 Tax=Psychroflexus montanilacus TaxID=2873598 RepID=UPI001CCEA598|nr:hypothetical protein [Psychroflexus montanilacus]MBZ9650944.1 hypothetical protein [Psychroflexus montanilacus]